VAVASAVDGFVHSRWTACCQNDICSFTATTRPMCPYTLL